MSVLKDKADVLRHIVDMRNLRPEVFFQNSMQNHHGKSVSYVSGDMPGSVDSSVKKTHVVREPFAEEGSDCEGGRTAGVAEGTSVEANCVDEDER